jgi:hypothetical protein
LKLHPWASNQIIQQVRKQEKNGKIFYRRKSIERAVVPDESNKEESQTSNLA